MEDLEKVASNRSGDGCSLEDTDPATRVEVSPSKKEITGDRSPSLLNFPMTDSGNAERLAALYGTQICYRTDGKCWHIYEPEVGVWREADEDEIKSLARRTVRQFREEINSTQYCSKDGESFALKSENSPKLNNLVREARTLPELWIPAKEFDDDALLLNVQNGKVDLRDGKLREHRPEDRFTRVCGAEYRKDNGAPQWENFLRTIFDEDEELIDYVQRAVGYALSGLASEQCMFVLKGDGANGKSTFLEVLREVLGSYAANTPVQTLLPGSRKGHDADLARLPNVRFLTVSELERDEELIESRVKRLTGQDRMAVREMYKGYFEYTPDFCLFMATNHWPKVSADDHAFWRRMRVIPFSVRIPPGKQNPFLKQELLNESGGILAWAIDGFQKWRKDPLKEQPQAAQKEKDRWRDTIDRCVSTFLESRVDRSTGESIRTSHVHREYADYCSNRNMEPLSHRQFNKRVQQHFSGSIYKKRKGACGSAHWVGIELNG